MSFTTTIQQYAQENSMSIQAARELFGLDKNDSSQDYRIVTYDQTPENYYKEHGYVMMDNYEPSSDNRTQNLQTNTPQDPKVEATKKRNELAERWRKGDAIDRVAVVLDGIANIGVYMPWSYD